MKEKTGSYFLYLANSMPAETAKSHDQNKPIYERN